MDQTPEGSQPADQPPAVPPQPAAPATPPPAAPATPPPAMPPPVVAKRPGVITAVAVLQFIAAGFGILFGVLALLGGGFLAGTDTSDLEVEGLDVAASSIGGVLIVLAVITLVIAAVQIYAGTQVLKLRERGRIISIVLSAISLALMALSLTQGDASGAVLSIALNGFILYACVSNKEAFSEQGI